jgi:hypothetical protein
MTTSPALAAVAVLTALTNVDPHALTAQIVAGISDDLAEEVYREINKASDRFFMAKDALARAEEAEKAAFRTKKARRALTKEAAKEAMWAANEAMAHANASVWASAAAVPGRPRSDFPDLEDVYFDMNAAFRLLDRIGTSHPDGKNHNPADLLAWTVKTARKAIELAVKAMDISFGNDR